MNNVDYSKFRFSKLNTPEFSHLKLLLFWLIYGITFWFLEMRSPEIYNAVECRIDSLIPFCEYFVIPYYFWFIFMIGMLMYTIFCDIPAFKKYMYFIIVTYTITCIIYIIYPTSQNLRPTEFGRDNVFIRVVRWMYAFDTNTNVCPSLHVMGTMAVCFTAWNIPRFKGTAWRAAFVGISLAICASTMFLKQHSFIDVIASLAISTAIYPFIFKKAVCTETYRP